MMKNAISLLSVLLLGATASVQAATFTNGGFDDVKISHSIYENLDVSSPKISPWKVTKGNVDIITGYWNAHAGLNSVDLLGTGINLAEIAQTFDTIPGQKYTVNFKLSANPYGERNIVKVVKVVVGNSNMKESLKFTYDPVKNGNSANDMKWQQHSFDFIASGNYATLTFSGSVANNAISSFGPVIDSVSVVSNGNSETCCTCYPCSK